MLAWYVCTAGKTSTIHCEVHFWSRQDEREDPSDLFTPNKGENGGSCSIHNTCKVNVLGDACCYYLKEFFTIYIPFGARNLKKDCNMYKKIGAPITSVCLEH